MPPGSPTASEHPKPRLRDLLGLARSGKLWELALELIRFGWVGFFTLGMYTVEMWLLAKVNSWPTWVNATVSYGPCLVTNYFLHRSFTFRSDKAHMKAGPRYLVIQLGGMAINSVGLWLGIEVLRWPYLPAQVGAIVVLAIWSYAGQKLWTFS